MSTLATIADTSRAKPTSLLRQLALPLGAISTVFVMLVPLPAAVMDVLLALSIAASVVVFLTAIQVRKATELSVFPTLLLLLTLFRLSLNLASSRRILLHGSEGTHAAAGSVIEAFGQFVVGGNLRRRLCALSRPHRYPVPRRLAWRSAHGRGHGALHP